MMSMYVAESSNQSIATDCRAFWPRRPVHAYMCMAKSAQFTHITGVACVWRVPLLQAVVHWHLSHKRPYLPSVNVQPLQPFVTCIPYFVISLKTSELASRAHMWKAL